MKTREQLIDRLEQIAFSARYEARDAIRAIGQLCQMQGYNGKAAPKNQINVQYIEAGGKVRKMGSLPTADRPEKPSVIEDCETLPVDD